MSKDPNFNRLLVNRYRLLDLVGIGAMGQVYRAADTLLGDVGVAVKFLSQTLLSQKMRDRFEREAKVSALLGEKSIHIVRVRDYGIDDLNNVPFYVMEYLDGESLSDLLKYHPLTLSRFFPIARQICLGLGTAHEGIQFQNQTSPIVHRDIKPSNIFIIPDPSFNELVKVLDFGIAKLIQSDDSQTHSFMGTLAYCSPEQMEGKELDNRSDIYSLGVMMYEMLTNDMPIIPETSSFSGWYRAHHELPPREFDSQLNLPPELSKLIYSCLAKSPTDRPQNITEMMLVLEKLERQISERSTEPGAGNLGGTGKSVGAKPPESVAPPQEEETRILLAEDEATQVEDSTQSSKQEVRIPPVSISAATDVMWRCLWPDNKPQQKIVFPKLVTTAEGPTVSLWAMLEADDVKNRSKSTRYNYFLCIQSPHPMLLWITVLYTPLQGPRWLPCYLDLALSSSRTMITTLGNLGNYRVLLFALGEPVPSRCRHVLKVSIAPDQCRLLQEWAELSAKHQTKERRKGGAKLSKNLLRQELGKIKPKILQKLQGVYLNY